MTRLPIKLMRAVLLVTALSARCVFAADVAMTSEEERIGRMMDPTIRLQTLEEWDTVFAAITKAIWQAHDVATKGQVALGGHPLDYYWDQYVLVPENKGALEALREKARQQSEAGDEKGLKVTLGEASPLLNAEKYKFAVLASFSTVNGSLQYQRAMLQPWLARATEAERAAAETLVRAGEEALVAALPELVQAKPYDLSFWKTLAKRASASVEALNAQRIRLVAEQSELANPIPLPAVTRNTACPPTVPPANDREKPGLGRDFPSSEDFYPDFVKTMGAQGSVIVLATISDSGCVIRVEVSGTSGVPELDKGALDLAMAGAYVPGSKDGNAVPGELRFRVKFELQE